LHLDRSISILANIKNLSFPAIDSVSGGRGTKGRCFDLNYKIVILPKEIMVVLIKVFQIVFKNRFAGTSEQV